ncbi:type I glyceraldehyde-3-phosphate dehydrogenase [Desulfatitalea alkaliphila]|uniref:Glyceraldehyde-3-phosphate dehydrogenase n=1 Tax=Desulfatitalea alkaliphila TaxID=2929485 RepID=A0AA41UHZ5_9BACT|nr:glyceraldehyde 3-phosphate dehydrogenase NAD-binding domain-containing protein [Desulfatitalea alkaliphila]MCJ8500190.1 glyceraldehyde-3-phosphate dehydrogenase [Desulfatitalea alkaliphila]
MNDIADIAVRRLGINGFGRIGKLTLWHHVGRKYFDEIVVNVGRPVGGGLADIAHYLQRDSTYGALHGYLHGYRGLPVVTDLDEAEGSMRVDGVPVRFLREERNPGTIGWGRWGVPLVVDTTGQFLDPTVPGDHAKGSLRGHLMCGAEKVILSAPFKIKAKATPMPEDAVTTVMGINESHYDPRRHKVISNASCTTTCLAHMIKPVMDAFGASRILSASMATVHAATGSQQVLDRLPKGGKSDLRKNRSILNNIILTTTGAAEALGLVIPEMKGIGFIAESVRIPTSTGSLIILVLSIQESPDGPGVTREVLHTIYERAAAEDPNGYLHFSREQNVSGDIIGLPRAAAIIEGHEIHTRTAELAIDLQKVPGIPEALLKTMDSTTVRPRVTQAVIYGWYDNEMGSYVNLLGDRTVSVAEGM